MTAPCATRWGYSDPCGEPAVFRVLCMCVHEHIRDVYACAACASSPKFCGPCWRATEARVPLTEVKREPVTT
jgi:hypothetical protein